MRVTGHLYSIDSGHSTVCYSAMVKQADKAYTRRFGARPDYDATRHLFKRRRDGERLTLPRSMEEPFLTDAISKAEKEIQALVLEWNKAQVPIVAAELQKQRDRLELALEKLQKKPDLKGAAKDRDIASVKIPDLENKIAWHESLDVTDLDHRIFPKHYVMMVYVNDEGERVVAPFRYHLRPAFADPSWDYKRDGAYNARRDSLKTAWKNQFGKKHGLLLVKRFWEHVEPKKYKGHLKLVTTEKQKKTVILMFEPNDHEWMIVPTIYDVWARKEEPTLYSTALITDDPRPEVAAAGHDRTPVSLTEAAANEWLNTKANSKDDLFSLLDEVKQPYYEHQLAA